MNLFILEPQQQDLLHKSQTSLLVGIIVNGGIAVEILLGQAVRVWALQFVIVADEVRVRTVLAVTAAATAGPAATAVHYASSLH